MEEMDGLLNLQMYFSGALSIRTSIMDFRTFENRVGLLICSRGFAGGYP